MPGTPRRLRRILALDDFEPAARAVLPRLRLRRLRDGTLVVTTDTAVSGNRENHGRVGFSSPLRPSAALAWQGLTHPRWLLGTALRTLVHHGMPHFENSQATRAALILARNAPQHGAAGHHSAGAGARRPCRAALNGLSSAP